MHTSFMFDDLAWRFAIIYSFIFDVVTLGLISIFAQLKLKKNNKNYEGVLFERMLCSINKNKYDITKKKIQCSMFPCVCAVVDHMWHQNVLRKKKWQNSTEHEEVTSATVFEISCLLPPSTECSYQ